MKKLFTIALVLTAFYLKAQNVGIGSIYPTNGRLVLNNNGSTSALVINDSASGLSLGDQNNPLIGFNNYFRSGRKFMSTGFASYLWFNPTNGLLSYFNTSISGTQGTLPAMTGRFTINKDGNVGIGVSDALAGLHVRGKSLLVDNATGFGDIILNPSYNTNGGGIELQNNLGVRTVVIRASDGSTQSGDLMFYDPTDNSTTMELDGDYASTGRSRIIVDELQIKGGADFAEYFDVAAIAGTLPEAGMLVSIDENNPGKLIVSNTAYDKKIAGVISGANGIKPGMMMGHKGTIADGEQPVAITGRVYVMAEALNNAINPGDMLTTSVIAGHAMKAANHKKAHGAVVGKAMSKLPAGTKGMVLVLLGIQ